METVLIDEQRQQQAKIYARLQRRLMLVGFGLSVIYLSAWLVFRWSVALRTALSAYTSNPWALTAVYAIILGGAFGLISLPLAYYEGFTLPHRFGLSNQSFKDWCLDLVKNGLVGGAIGLFMLEVIYAVLRAAPETWWLWAAGFLLVFNILMANLAPLIIFPIFYRFEPLPAEHAGLVERLMRLADRADTHVRGVFQFDMSRRTSAANAALTGLGNTRRIILADTLLNEFTHDEIETVMAHELGHHVHRDIPLGILFESLLTLVGLYLASLGLEWGITALGLQGPGDVAGMPLFALVFLAYGLLTMPAGNAFSRWRERMADAYALQTTGNGAAYADALARLANQNLGETDPEPWVEWLLYSHPALGKRIARARNYQP